MGPTILAIESSCDETSAAVITNGKVLNNIIASQSVHQKYGGVVPELASRAHQQQIVQVVDRALSEAGIVPGRLDAIAFTRGPGLIGALLVGVSFAKGLALALQKPLIEVNHMQAHVLAHFIKDPVPAFPFLCLTVSGGHTQLVLVEDFLTMRVVGETQDDAAGEAFDKAAKLLGIPYPGGPLIDRYAREGRGDAFRFARTVMPGFDYSFSGIKTSFMYFLRAETSKDPEFIAKHRNDLCASLQRTLVDMLLEKMDKAAQAFGVTQLAVAGGVAANSELRSALSALGARRGWSVYIPDFQYCTDNAAMIAMAAHYKFLAGDFTSQEVSPLARYALS
ncbi:MAG: tRNA (adenosine(37)-N6)-threonylcarbamoyltransferase complex transferase subunit TsaD [Cyclobacteriaceae bacterium]|nr:tRNA (adenosine(37)-N6)-threonylcarbamoyltransferase complex transferase subunit TsaD [Cyclobacteriaceae bacterium]